MTDPYPESNSGYWEERCEKAVATIAKLEGALREHRPWDCADCGPMVKIDEDGCCATCGRDATHITGGEGSPPAGGSDG